MFVVVDENLCVKCIKDVFEYALDFTLYNENIFALSFNLTVSHLI